VKSKNEALGPRLTNLTKAERGCLIIWLTKVMPPHSLKIFEAFISEEEPYKENREIVRRDVPPAEWERFDLGDMKYSEIKRTIPGISDGSLRAGLKFLTRKGFLVHRRKLYRISQDPNLQGAMKNMAQLATRLYGIDDPGVPDITFYPVELEEDVVRVTVRDASLERMLSDYGARLLRNDSVVGRLWSLFEEGDEPGKLSFSDEDGNRTLSSRDCFFSCTVEPGSYRLEITYKEENIASLEWQMDAKRELKNVQ
jgi:hypothetical protein